MKHLLVIQYQGGNGGETIINEVVPKETAENYRGSTLVTDPWGVKTGCYVEIDGERACVFEDETLDEHGRIIVEKTLPVKTQKP